MFTKLFGRNGSTDAAAEADAKAVADAAREAISAEEKALWQAKLQAATGDDAALLALANEAPLLDIRHAAVQAIQSEETLKAAERAFRDHDRRVHREAKAKLDRAIHTREARAAASTLLDGGDALLALETIPANRLVELDHAWAAIDTDLLDAPLIARFQTIDTALSSRVRERGEQQLTLKRWLADTDRVLAYHMDECLKAIEAGEPNAALAAAGDAVNTALATRPSGNLHPDVRAKQQALEDAKQDNEAVVSRLSFLIRLNHPDTAAASPRDEWRAAPACAAARLAVPLDQRMDAWLNARRTSQQDAKKEARLSQKQESDKARDEIRAGQLTLLAAAEQALAEGHLAETIKALAKLDEAALKAPFDKKIQASVNALQAEVARLKGWQHWGGGRVREDLVEAAEGLAKAVGAEKINLKLHGDAINALRERWKEVDKLGGATNKELWTRFDGALKLAFTPIGEQLAKQKAQRQENMAERNKLIATLDATVIEPPAADGTPAKPDLRAVGRVLEQFQLAWRKLGPVEHTVPAKSKDALLVKMRASVSRLESPLNEARNAEEARRQALIAEATALSADSNARDTINRVRDLQKKWQQSAQGLPLARNQENKLWASFKAATDAVFTNRDAANTARDQTFSVERTRRQELIARVRALNTETPADALRKELAAVDAEWRKGGEAARNDAPKLDSQYRAAREAAQALLAGSATRAWQRVCDALVAKSVLVDEAVTAEDPQWTALPTLSVVWEKSLAARRNPAAASALDQLLQLEMALDLPTPEAFTNARRDLKLRAMKQAIEARGAPSLTDADIERWVADVVGSGVKSSDSRFGKIMAALGNRPLKLAGGAKR